MNDWSYAEPSAAIQEELDSIRSILKDSVEDKQSPCVALLIAQHDVGIIVTLMIISIRSTMGVCVSIVVFIVSAIVVVVDDMVVSI